MPRPTRIPAAARMWAAAGNMWLAAGQPGKAALDLDKALAMPGLEAEQRGEALLDRARAAEAQNDLKTARAKLSEAAASDLRRSFLLVLLGRACDPRERRGNRAGRDRKALSWRRRTRRSCSRPAMSRDFIGDDDKARAIIGSAPPDATPTARSARPRARRSRCCPVSRRR